MVDVTIRPLDRWGDVEPLQRLASRVWPAGWHPGGLGWALIRDELATEVVVAIDDVEQAVVGWAGRSGDEAVEFHAQVSRGTPNIATALVDWLLDGPTPRVGVVVATIWDGAPELAAAVEAAGFTSAGRDAWAGLFKDAEGAASDSRIAVDGYTIRPVGDAPEEVAKRVEVHRAAWRPASLPYTDGRELDPQAESSFSAEVYEAVRESWLYDRALDLVAVTEDGTFGAACIGWFDPETGVSEIEPMGVVPAHRRRGLAVALCLEVAARTHDRGGRQVFINTMPVEGYPAPAAAYMKAGFQLTQRATRYVRDVAVGIAAGAPVIAAAHTIEDV